MLYIFLSSLFSIIWFIMHFCLGVVSQSIVISLAMYIQACMAMQVVWITFLGITCFMSETDYLKCEVGCFPWFTDVIKAGYAWEMMMGIKNTDQKIRSQTGCEYVWDWSMVFKKKKEHYTIAKPHLFSDLHLHKVGLNPKHVPVCSICVCNSSNCGKSNKMKEKKT